MQFLSLVPDQAHHGAVATHLDRWAPALEAERRATYSQESLKFVAASYYACVAADAER